MLSECCEYQGALLSLLLLGKMMGDNKSRPFQNRSDVKDGFRNYFHFHDTAFRHSDWWLHSHCEINILALRHVHTANSPRFDPRRRTWTKISSTGGVWPFTLGRWMVISSSLTRTVTTSYCYCSRRGYASGSAPLWLGCVMRRAAENESNWLISQITRPAVCRPSNGVGYPLRANLATVPKLITETAICCTLAGDILMVVPPARPSDNDPTFREARNRVTLSCKIHELVLRFRF